MALGIGNDLPVLLSQKSLRSHNLSIEKSVGRLSTGFQINSASDDSAGLAKSQKLTAQINGAGQAIRNLNDGISLMQTADGALDSTTDLLQRMRELAVQSANASNNAENRNYLDVEFQSLLSEVERISKKTHWNGMSLLDGTFNSKLFQAGANAADSIPVTLGATSSSALGLNSSRISNTQYGQFAVQFAYAGATPVMFKASLNNATNSLLTSIDSDWANASNVTNKTTIRLADFVYGGNGGPPGRGHITIAPGGLVPNEQVTIDYQGDVFPWNAVFINYELTDGVYTIRNVGSNSAGVTSISAAFSSGATTYAIPNFVQPTMPAVQISNQTDAANTLTRIDSALGKINAVRSSTGSYINRFEAGVNHLNTNLINTASAKSRISDTDYASETANLAKSIIMQQAAQAMLVQANQSSRMVIALLK
jgi:flagellin